MRDILHAYVDGFDLEGIAPVLKERIAALLSSRRWACDVWLVDQQHDVSGSKSGDLPEWDLGVNMDPASSSKERYREDLISLYRGLSKIAVETGRDFVFGIRGEDCLFTCDQLDDSELIRRMG